MCATQVSDPSPLGRKSYHNLILSYLFVSAPSLAQSKSDIAVDASRQHAWALGLSHLGQLCHFIGDIRACQHHVTLAKSETTTLGKTTTLAKPGRRIPGSVRLRRRTRISARVDGWRGLGIHVGWCRLRRVSHHRRSHHRRSHHWWSLRSGRGRGSCF